jgi:hypothetical protein
MSDETPESNISGAIYGTILSMAVISTASKDPDIGPIAIAGWAVATAMVFWLAHAYSHIVADGIARPKHAGGLIRLELRREWPLVQGAMLPAAAMLLAPLGIVSEITASYVAVGAGLVVLFAAGVLMGARQDLSTRKRLTIGGINALIGSTIVILKIFVH